MLRKTIFLLLSFLLIGFAQLPAQTSSKSKSSDKLYERGKKKKPVRLKNLKRINSSKLEFSPQFYQNGLVYVTSVVNSTKKDKRTGDNYYDLFYTEFGEDGLPNSVEPFSVKVSSSVHEGPVTFSRDFSTLYYTTNSTLKLHDADNNGKKDHTLKIFEAKKGTHDWQDVKELPFNSESYYCFHPALSPDGSKLYFASNMPGGYGGSDIYVAKKRGNNWSIPENLGPEINTPENDAFPFFHESGNLFFSSKGHNAVGGYDIYIADMNDGTPEVYNLGPPFNTVKDDLGLILNQTGDSGFFTSGRNGGVGSDDIYHFVAPDGLLSLNSSKPKQVTIMVTDAGNNSGIKGAKVRILEQASDGFLEGDDVYDVEMVANPNNPEELVFKLKRKDVSDIGSPTKTTYNTGEVYANLKGGSKYIILVSKEGYANEEKMFIPTFGLSEEFLEIPLRKSACISINGEVVTASTRYGISSANLVITNECDGSTQTVTSNSSGNFNVCVPPGCSYSIRSEKGGYITSTSSFSTSGRNPGSSLSTNIQMSKAGAVAAAKPSAPVTTTRTNTTTTNNSSYLSSGNVSTGDVIELQNIYYDFGKSTIRSGAARDLDALVALMRKYPSMEIELISHTDSRGSTSFNQNLSLKRAESAKNYISSRGISRNRIKAFGYGEDELRNHCEDGVKCEENEHEFNRRTEVRIAKIDKTVKVNYKVRKP